MAETCQICGATTMADARFCHGCGAAVDVDVIDLATPLSASPDKEAQRSRRPTFRRLAVPVGLTALVGAVGLLLLSPSDDLIPRQDPAPPGIAANEAPSERAATPDSSLTPRPRATAEMAAPAVDVSALPDLDASHIVVASGRNLQFLDLTTGVWVRADVQTVVYDVTPVTGGVGFELASGAAAFASAETGEVTRISDGNDWFLGIFDEQFVVYAVGDEADDELRLEGRRTDGSLAWTFELTANTWPNGLTDGGHVIYQANEWVALYDIQSGTSQVLTTGGYVGTIADLVLVSSCSPQLACGIDQINIATGERHRVIDDAGWFEATTDTTMVFRPFGRRPEIRYELVDGVLTTAAIDPLESFPPLHPPEATDASGVTVRHVGTRFRILDPDNVVLASISSPLGENAQWLTALMSCANEGVGCDCCDDVLVALISR